MFYKNAFSSLPLSSLPSLFPCAAPGDFSPVNKSLLLSGDRIIEPITITQDRNVEVQETFFVNLTSNSDLVQLERRDAVVFIDDSVVPGS